MRKCYQILSLFFVCVIFIVSNLNSQNSDKAFFEKGKENLFKGFWYYEHSPYSEQYYKDLRPPWDNDPCSDYDSQESCENAFIYYRKAITNFDEAIRANPNYAEAYYYRAETYLMMGATNIARRDYIKACILDNQYCK